MIWLRKLLGLCVHKWVRVNERDVRGSRGVKATIYLLQCEKCGCLKKVRIDA